MALRLLEPGETREKIREIAISSDEFLIGRGVDCDLRLYETAVSRHHCLIRSRGPEVTIADLGSANGTFVNGTRVMSQINVRTGDEINIGAYRFLVDLGDDPNWAEEYFSQDLDPRATTKRFPPESRP